MAISARDRCSQLTQCRVGFEMLPRFSKMFIYAAVFASGLLTVGCDNPDPAQVKRGKQVALRCKNCHSFDKQVNKIGPTLVSVLGRKAGTVPGYEYSEAMKRYGREWSPQNIEEFVEHPNQTVAGTKMIISPVTPEQARDVVAYIRSLD
jgi:cytochrome c